MEIIGDIFWWIMSQLAFLLVGLLPVGFFAALIIQGRLDNASKGENIFAAVVVVLASWGVGKAVMS